MAISPISQNIVSAINSNNAVKPAAKDSTDSTTQSTKTDNTQTSKPAADTVQISSSAKAKAAVQEALETPTQTAKEARTGDAQARRLLAKEAAAEEAKETPKERAQEA